MTPKSLLYTLFSSITLAIAASVPDTTYDVIVVGGGPAGLSAISGLSRVRRKTVLFDSGEYRNGPTRDMHDVIGNDGTPPGDFRALAREQISRYDTASFVDKKIVSITPQVDDGALSYFEAKDSDGEVYSARKVVLGTGLRDILPETPGVAEIWGKGMFWCPWCDGYEHRDQPIGVLGLEDPVGNILELHSLYTDIVVLANGTQTPEVEAELSQKNPNWKAQLAAWNVRIDNRVIQSFHRLQDGEEVQDENKRRQFDVFLVRFTDGSTLVRNAFLTNFPREQRSTLPAQLGLQMINDQIDTANFTGMRTSMSGVFAVGDAAFNSATNVPFAMFSGKRAAVYSAVELAREESAAAISKRNLPSRRAMEKEVERLMGRDLEALWEQAQRQ